MFIKSKKYDIILLFSFKFPILEAGTRSFKRQRIVFIVAGVQNERMKIVSFSCHWTNKILSFAFLAYDELRLGLWYLWWLQTRGTVGITKRHLGRIFFSAASGQPTFFSIGSVPDYGNQAHYLCIRKMWNRLIVLNELKKK